MADVYRVEAPWVLVEPGGEQVARCTRCGSTLTLGLPRRLVEFVSAVRVFATEHRQCPEVQA